MTEILPQSAAPDEAAEPWRDTALPAAERVADLVRRMTLEEKAGQLGAFWAAPDASESESTSESAASSSSANSSGAPVAPTVGGPVVPAPGAPERAARLRAMQSEVMRGNRFRVPAIAHEECTPTVRRSRARTSAGSSSPERWGWPSARPAPNCRCAARSCWRDRSVRRARTAC